MIDCFTPEEAINYLLESGETKYTICKALSEPKHAVQYGQINAWQDGGAMTYKVAVKFYLMFDIHITRIFEYGSE